MANPIQSLIPNFFAVDVVGVYTQDFRQVFKLARPIKANIREDSKVMQHPVENGTIITDHRVVLPVEIELSMMLSAETYADTYKEIKKYFTDGTLLIVQTQSDTYKNQLIQSIPHEENPANYNALVLALKLIRVQITVAQFGLVPQDPANSTLVDRGTINGTVPSVDKINVANDAYSRFVQ